MTDWISFDIVIFFFQGYFILLPYYFWCYSLFHFWLVMRFFLFLLLALALGNLSGFDQGFHNKQRNAFVCITKGICVGVWKEFWNVGTPKHLCCSFWWPHKSLSCFWNFCHIILPSWGLSLPSELLAVFPMCAYIHSVYFRELFFYILAELMFITELENQSMPELSKRSIRNYQYESALLFQVFWLSHHSHMDVATLYVIFLAFF